MYTKNALIYKLRGYRRYPAKLNLLKDEIFRRADKYEDETLNGPMKLVNTMLHYATNSLYKGLMIDFIFPEFMKEYPIEERMPLKEFNLQYEDVYSLYYEVIGLGLQAETMELLTELYTGCSNYHDYFLFTMFVLILGGERAV